MAGTRPGRPDGADAAPAQAGAADGAVDPAAPPAEGQGGVDAVASPNDAQRADAGTTGEVAPLRYLVTYPNGISVPIDGVDTVVGYGHTVPDGLSDKTLTMLTSAGLIQAVARV